MQILKLFILPSVKNAIGILIGIALNLQSVLSRMAILTILILPIHEHKLYFHLFISFLFLSSTFYSFHSISFLPPWLNLFLGFYSL